VFEKQLFAVLFGRRGVTSGEGVRVSRVGQTRPAHLSPTPGHVSRHAVDTLRHQHTRLLDCRVNCRVSRVCRAPSHRMWCAPGRRDRRSDARRCVSSLSHATDHACSVPFVRSSAVVSRDPRRSGWRLRFSSGSALPWLRGVLENSRERQSSSDTHAMPRCTEVLYLPGRDSRKTAHGRLRGTQYIP
jgi:hypothetical protein